MKTLAVNFITVCLHLYNKCFSLKGKVTKVSLKTTKPKPHKKYREKCPAEISSGPKFAVGHSYLQHGIAWNRR